VKLSVLEKDMILRDNLIWLLGAQAICILPLLISLPGWIWLVWGMALLWRVQIHRGRLFFPPPWIKLLLGLGCAGGIYGNFSGFRGVEPMVGFLVCAFILKVIEMRTKKDALIVLFIGFIAVAAQFLFAQDMLAGAYGIFSLFVLLSAWQAAYYSRPISPVRHFQLGGALVLKSIPFMVILFVVMPRLGPLWAVPLPQGKGKTGFSDSLSMGDLGELVRSPDVAFRVTFEGLPPRVRQLYWRGLVLDEFDGSRWRVGARPARTIRQPSGLQIDPREHVEYSVIMEPHHYRWLFVLDPVIAADSAQMVLERDDRGLLSALRPVVNKVEYSAVSLRSAPRGQEALLPFQTRMLTSLPEGNPRARVLAETWLQQERDQEAVVSRALQFFTGDFVYTMQPPVLGAADAVDNFLFDSQRGFCEHFASSFVFLMRAAGIPARIVLGYQGGEFNTLESYFVVRQSDAHAWAEVWLEGEGWKSVDPTAAVVPSRIEMGVVEALDEDERALVGQPRWTSDLARALQRHWDALGYSWNRWVLNYNRDNQQSLFTRLLGGNSAWRVGIAFVGLSIGLFAVYGVAQFLARPRLRLRPEDQWLRPLLRRMARGGWRRLPQETLGQFAARVSSSEPALGCQLASVAELYAAAVYAGDSSAREKLRELLRQMKWNGRSFRMVS
jgi:transglutaminase-like putative cysteine protease